MSENRLLHDAVEWYCSNYLKLEGEDFYVFKNAITLEHFVRAIENKVMHKGASVLKSPVKIEWHITKRCNLSCSFCYSCAIGDSVEELDTNKMISIIHQMQRANVLEVQIEGGEPFLRKDLNILLDELKKKYIRIRLLTNGTIINESVLNTIESSFTTDDVLQVSLHGFNNETHDRIVGKEGAFNSVIMFLNTAEAMRLPVRVSCVISKDNIHDLEKLLITVSEYQCVESFVMQPIIPVGRGDTSSMISSSELILKYYSMSRMETKVSLSMLLGHAYDIPALADYVIKKGVKEQRVYCAAGRSRLHIDERGNVYPCHFLAYPDFFLGSLLETSIEELWKNDANTVVQSYSREESDCKECKMSMHCTKKGFCTSYLNDRSIKAKPINCFI